MSDRSMLLLAIAMLGGGLAATALSALMNVIEMPTVWRLCLAAVSVIIAVVVARNQKR